MGLRLQTVPASRGLKWVAEGFTGFFHHPGGYTALFVLFMLAAVMVSLVPLLGAPLLMMGAPLLSLAYMMAVHQAGHGRLPHPRVFLQVWQGPPLAQRRALLGVCIAYALSTIVLMALCDLIDDGRFYELLTAVANGQADEAELNRLATAPGVMAGALARTLVTAVLSVPFWHAPALVVWGGQGPAQAMFSSALALWRTRAAFFMYGLGWTLVLIVTGLLATLMLMLLGQGALATLLIMPLPLLLTVAFYVSLYASFRDSFGEPEARLTAPAAG